MTKFDAATQAQVDATSPHNSTWLSANAGSGKTRVLTNRVALLLLEGARPQNIVCLTYTNAAAVEMQNRLVDRLGSWAMMGDAKLTEELSGLGHGEHFSKEQLAEARTLFASAIETPGGLRIQTIHSFCSAVMRRFPLEAGISPLFRELDERNGAALRSEILRSMTQGADTGVIAPVLANYSQLEFDKFVQELGRYREQVRRDVDAATIRSWYGLPSHAPNADLANRTIDENDLQGLRDCVEPLLAIGQVAATDLANDLSSHGLRQVDFGLLETLFGAFLTKKNEKKKTPVPAPLKKSHPDLADRLEQLAERTLEAKQQQLSEKAATATLALHKFATAFLDRYDAAKRDRGFLDFDDLIRGTEDLLTDRRVADWVMYKLDGGIDHVLVDEAQDTNPAQWRVIKLLTQNMTEPAAGGALRTIFVVGDKKQSIYSFQGAEPAAFDDMRNHYRDFLNQAGLDLQDRVLNHSFRSAPTILSTVDKVFENVDQNEQFSARHYPFYEKMPGRVDLWPVIPKRERIEPTDWTDLSHPDPIESEQVELASKIAQEIQNMISTGRLTDKDGNTRRIKGGDILILVQRRSALFNHIITACKRLNLPIAGSDRLKLGAELAVNDILALLSFLALPQDSLSLAVALRSPLFGLSEKDLFKIAHSRNSTDLWVELTNRRDQFPQTTAMLDDLRRLVDYMPPFELIEHILTHWDGRRKLIARLGSEAEEGIDILLGKALEFDAGAPASLTGFLAWIEKDETDVKRQAEQAGENLRVMTVHGAKGLEAPIVFLPDTSERRPPVGEPLMLGPNRNLLWQAGSSFAPALQREGAQENNQKVSAERLRLLYVAMTRTESWLIVCSAGNSSDGNTAWYKMVKDALDAMKAQPLASPTGEGLRYSEGDWPDPVEARAAGSSSDSVALPDYFRRRVDAPVRAKPTLTPSKMEGEKVISGQLGVSSDRASAKGTAIHLLLEKSDRTNMADFEASAHRILAAAQVFLSQEDLGDAISQARAVLTDPEFSHIFGANALAEVEFSVPAQIEGYDRIHGVIDRLVVDDGVVTVVDYKSNSLVPKNPDDIPEGILNQMRAYYQAAQSLYPQCAVSCSILWTATPELMPIPHNIVTQPINQTSRS